MAVSGGVSPIILWRPPSPTGLHSLADPYVTNTQRGLFDLCRRQGRGGREVHGEAWLSGRMKRCVCWGEQAGQRGTARSTVCFGAGSPEPSRVSVFTGNVQGWIKSSILKNPRPSEKCQQPELVGWGVEGEVGKGCKRHLGSKTVSPIVWHRRVHLYGLQAEMCFPEILISRTLDVSRGTQGLHPPPIPQPNPPRGWLTDGLLP